MKKKKYQCEYCVAPTAEEIEIIGAHVPMSCNNIKHDIISGKPQKQHIFEEDTEVQTVAPERE